MELDITQALKDAENALRDFIVSILGESFGDAWEEQCGVSPERLAKWHERKAVEEKQQVSGVVEERLIYYAEFYDLQTILKKHWNLFAAALGEWKTMDVWLTMLNGLRNPDAHRRELLPHQKHLAIGISGEIRTRIVRFRSQQETADNYFPRIESVRDNYGNLLIATADKILFTKTILRPGDVVDFVITASDPLEEQLMYSLDSQSELLVNWQSDNMLSFRVEAQHIDRSFQIILCIKSQRTHHANSRAKMDDMVMFFYTVLPA